MLQTPSPSHKTRSRIWLQSQAISRGSLLLEVLKARVKCQQSQSTRKPPHSSSLPPRKNKFKLNCSETKISCSTFSTTTWSPNTKSYRKSRKKSCSKNSNISFIFQQSEGKSASKDFAHRSSGKIFGFEERTSRKDQSKERDGRNLHHLQNCSLIFIQF